MKLKKFIGVTLSTMMVVGALAGCSNTSTTTPTNNKVEDDKTTHNGQKAEEKLEPITFTYFLRDPGQVPSKDNPIIKKVQEETGVTIEFETLVGELDQKIGVMIASEDYPDMVFGDVQKLLDADAFIPLDDLIEQYAPNLKKLYEPYENIMKQAGDGEIKVLDIYGTVQGEELDFWHSGPAFWIQKDVLAQAGYPLPKTLDEYFTLIEDYMAKNPTVDGQPTVGFEVLSDGWRAFCLKNAPQHLIGGPNDGGVYVNLDTYQAELYADKDYAKKYYKKLNEEYHKGIISADTFTQSYDQYLAKISTGRVLGMFDQHWNFLQGEGVLQTDKRYDRTYVPLPITYEGYTDHYRERRIFTGVCGLGITKNCKDPVRLIKYLDYIAQEDIQTLLNWGIEGEDYTVEADGTMVRNAEVIEKCKDENWKRNNTGWFLYNNFPKIEGLLSNGNSVQPGQSPREYQASLSEYDKEFLSHYGFNSIVDFLSSPPMNQDYYPVYSMDLGDGSAAKVAEQKLGDLQLQYLPSVILADESKFDTTWDEYVNQLNGANPQAYLDRVNEMIKVKMGMK